MAEEKRQLCEELVKLRRVIESGQINRYSPRARQPILQRKHDIEARLREIDREERRDHNGS